MHTGLTEPNSLLAIADMFAEKYDGLYTSVPYDSVEMAEIVSVRN